jgi:hypothetical protein
MENQLLRALQCEKKYMAHVFERETHDSVGKGLTTFFLLSRSFFSFGFLEKTGQG